MFRLFLLFSIIPIVEIYLLVKAGTVIGPLPTVALLLLVSLAGAWLVRHQGFEILRRIQLELSQGRMPAADLLDGFMVLLGGILLVTPGFFTDVLGLLFIIPPSRRLMGRFVVLWIRQRLSRGAITIIHPRP